VQVLIQEHVISCLDFCNSLLAGLPAWAIKPLQLIQNAAACLVEAYIHCKTMVLTYGAARGTTTPYLQAMLKPYTTNQALFCHLTSKSYQIVLVIHMVSRCYCKCREMLMLVDPTVQQYLMQWKSEVYIHLGWSH
jgi:hypothetical protein